MNRRCLILGGARSGKSRHAERLAWQSGLQVVYIATGWAGDEEMATRIAHHQAQRPKDWQTVEEPHALAAALATHAAPGRCLLVDCLTLWLTNLMLGGHAWQAAGRALVAALAAQADPVIFVTNEVGAGIVPDNALAREFRDAAGTLNQWVAAVADEVTLAVAGLPLKVK
jgi:adenosylcobinamide kinase/adenosylcobinamide-phosphate guanylyltransferase